MNARYILVFAGLVSACAAPTRLPPPDGSLDGIYVGHRTIDATCGTQSQPITFHVSGAEISVLSHHKKHRLEGTVAANGQIALSDFGRRRDIEGQITGDQLIASETDSPSNKKNHKALSPQNVEGSPCIWHYEATRVPTSQPAPEAPGSVED